MGTAVNTTALLNELHDLAARKADAIKELLAERVTLRNNTDKRLFEIGAALKELGHKRKITRKPKEAKTAKAK